MITLYLRPNTSLNTSLQIGDAIYAKRTNLQPGAEDAEGAGNVGGTDGKYNVVTLTHENISTNANIHAKIAKAVARIAANPGRGKVITVVDTANSVVAEEFENDNNTTQVTCTALAITQG